MGSRYLTDMADVLRAAGLDVIEMDGWQKRARGSGGYDSGRPNHIMIHHTASGVSSDGWPDANYCTLSAQDKPLCNLYINRAGSVWVCAGGATNTNGSGKDPCGVTNDDSMNSSAIGIEAGNNGVGELWPAPQLDAYLVMCRALGGAYGIPDSRTHSHFEWSPGRKIDPAGPDRYASGSASWNMGQFRAEVAGAPVPTPVPPTPTPVPPTPPTEPTVPPAPAEGDFMAALPTIKKGDSGPYVERMQHLLAAASYMDPANTSNYDGAWGNGTDGAKARFDADHGLGGSDTSCGPKSWESLMTDRVW